jgi:Carboxypeptidase regulatory-like domain
VRKLVFATAVLCLLYSINSFAQSNATLGGTVTDASGASIPGVTVSARNVATGIVNETLSNETGAYQFANLQTGTYEVKAELPGFQTQRFTNVTLGVSQQVRLNVTMSVANVATTVEVTTVADTALATTSGSIATVLTVKEMPDLPLGDRNILGLLSGMAGTGATRGLGLTLDSTGFGGDGYFAGNRLNAVNVTLDGLTVSAGRYDQGVLGVTYMSPDLIEEVRVTTSNVDASATRGSGQMQMVTRSGTNQFRGSAFWNNRNSKLSASNWFNNFNGVPKDFENRNQFGVRIGGPIIKNKTFFFFLIDDQRYASRQDVVGTVLTEQARQGIFRFFPGADNRNALQTNPSVDRNGNLLRPAGELQSINLFALPTPDPFRTGFDPSSYMQKVILARMPKPNDYTVGDGLNTAGIRNARHIYGLDTNIQETVDRNNRNQYNVRIDHNFNSNNKLSFVYQLENSENMADAQGIHNWPGEETFDGQNNKYPRVYNFSFVSTLSANAVNELRAGYRVHNIKNWGPIDVGRNIEDDATLEDVAKRARALVPNVKGIPIAVVPQIFTNGFMTFSANSSFAATRGSYDPLLSISDTFSWTQGKHAFKAGFEHRRDRTQGYNNNNFTPFVQLGAGTTPAQITNTTVPGLTSPNATTAQNVLYNLSGSIDSVRQGFDLRKPTDQQFKGYQDGVKLKLRDWRANEISAFFKDDWKVTKNLTLNLGLHWDLYGVPYEASGLAGRGAGGYKGVCPFSQCGPVTVEFVGKNSPQPGKKFFNNDWNNFAPAVGFSWSIPGLGQTTILRAGYGISYSGRQIAQAMSTGGLDSGGTLPGTSAISGGNGLTYRPGAGAYWSLADLSMIPFQPQFLPLQPVSLTDRTLNMNYYEPERRVPYIQNFTLSLQRQLARDLILDVTYVGSKGTKLYGRLPLNVADINSTGFLEAFNITRAGGTATLFNQMLMGLTIPGAGKVDGTTVTGSQALRLFSSTRTLLANGSPGALADFLVRNTTVTGQAGGFIRNGGFAEDFLVPYPQFNEVGVNANPSNSTYHSMQLQVTKRLAQGFTGQGSYTWSRNLGLSDTDHDLFARDPKNRNADKTLLGFHRTHIISGNGTYALPFGTNRRFLSAAPAFVQQLIGQWQLGSVFRWTTGAPLSMALCGANCTQMTIWQNAGGNTPDILGDLPKAHVVQLPGKAPTVFPTLKQDKDPNCAGVTPANTLNSACSLLAIFDSQGKPLLVNPAPGKVGSLGKNTVEGPSRFQLDMNLQKRLRVDERREVEIRADVTNVLNHPVFAVPTLNINSANFGQIDSAGAGRQFTLGARLNF